MLFVVMQVDCRRDIFIVIGRIPSEFALTTAGSDVLQAPVMPSLLLFMIELSGAYYSCGCGIRSYAGLSYILSPFLDAY